MAKFKCADQTLPSVVASIPGERQDLKLILTIIFHPSTSRIGESAVVGKIPGVDTRLLGRECPCFGRAGRESMVSSLDDPYVSKEAIQIRYGQGETVILSRDSSSSRAQVGGRELAGKVRLSREQLRAGVPIILGGRVVLLLRRACSVISSSNTGKPCEPIHGSSAYMCKLRAQISQLAQADLDVLIRGETGTGKELVAQALHVGSKRALGKLICVNMAAIPAALAPTILFGSARGAFTGADKATVGYFEQAEGATLFLDEIGDTPTEVQAQLLRVLQQREVQPVGGVIRAIDIRVISATDAPLEGQACNFKAALRHRLAESEVVLLPLRQHPEDIGELLWIFIKENLTSLGCSHVLPDGNSEANEIARWAEIFYQFVAYAWPGNIRELSNFAGQIALASQTSVAVPETVIECVSRSLPVIENVTALQPQALGIVDYSDQEFLRHFRRASYEVTRAARQLGISRQAIYRRISDSPDLCLASELSDDQINNAMRSYGSDIKGAAMELKVSRIALRERIRNCPTAWAG